MKSYLSKVARRLELLDVRSLADARLLLHVLVFSAAVPVLLRLKITRLSLLLEPRGRAALDPTRVEKITAYVDSALPLARPLVRSGCLTRGLTLYYFLRRAGLDVVLCFGVGELEPKFSGHCWLERRGEPFLEKSDPRGRFTETYRMPPAAPPRISQRPPGLPADERSRG